MKSSDNSSSTMRPVTVEPARLKNPNPEKSNESPQTTTASEPQTTTGPSPSPTPEPKPEPKAEPIGPISDGSHLDEIAVDDPDAAPPVEPESIGVGSDGFITPEAFHQGFLFGFVCAGELLNLDTLRGAAKRETAEPASRAIYDTIRDMPSLHFMIQPGAVWFKRLMTIGAFVMPLAVECTREIKQARANVAPPSTDGEPGGVSGEVVDIAKARTSPEAKPMQEAA